MRAEKLSKVVSYALRHAPWLYELELDAEGWAPVDQLLDALRAKGGVGGGGRRGAGRHDRVVCQAAFRTCR
ncbi:RNA 2'-phosphotransferase [Haloechinothrix halophila]|uniref:RNA 2'-phosphotransferase n=1 Tax=Haloechinothrix halophila TaxID=1069073 RepID=UPI0018C892E5